MEKFGVHDGRDKHVPKQPWKQFDGIDQNQIVQWAGIRDDDPHAPSEPDVLQIPQVSLKFGHRHRLRDAMGRQERVRCGTGPEPQQAAQLGPGQAARSIFRTGQRFQCASRQIGAIGAHPFGDLVGDVEDQIHGCSLSGDARNVSLNRRIGAPRRPRVGPFLEASAIPLDKPRAPEDTAPASPDLLLPVSTALADIPALALTQAKAVDLLHGQAISLVTLMGRIPGAADPDGGLVRAMAGGRVLGLCRLEDGMMKPERML